ncbi:unnamed protein product [Colias eurytheme]|nr:unnamed protein product [Colias eurytheme]
MLISIVFLQMLDALTVSLMSAFWNTKRLFLRTNVVLSTMDIPSTRKPIVVTSSTVQAKVGTPLLRCAMQKVLTW